MMTLNFTKVTVAVAVAVQILNQSTTVTAFGVAPTLSHRSGRTLLHSDKSVTSVSATLSIEDCITINDKLALRDPTPEERAKGGVEVATDAGDGIKALEVLARIPRNLILTTSDMSPRVVDAVSEARNITWATQLTAVTLAALHPVEEEIVAAGGSSEMKQAWIQSWKSGGWGSAADLGPDIAEDVVGTLIATGSDLDHEVYRKFRMPCHPALMKASMGLNFLTQCTEEEAREALTERGFTYRSMRDALEGFVLQSTERTQKGTVRDKRCWDVGDALDRVLSRATTLQLESDETTLAHVIVPIHERLAHSLNANSKLVSIDNEVLLIATRDIEAGEAITRDYRYAPRIGTSSSEQLSDGEELTALQLLLQFGLPPSAWPKSNNGES